MKVAPEVSRVLSFAVTYKGEKRAVIVTLSHGDLLVIWMEEFGVVLSISLVELFWSKLRSNPAMQKHRLQPRTCKRRVPGAKSPKKVPDCNYAAEYGVSRGTIGKWRKAGAPLSNPDGMGEYLFSLPQHGGTKPKKQVLA